MEKKVYESAEMEVVYIGKEDVVRTSNTDETERELLEDETKIIYKDNI